MALSMSLGDLAYFRHALSEKGVTVAARANSAELRSLCATHGIDVDEALARRRANGFAQIARPRAGAAKTETETAAPVLAPVDMDAVKALVYGAVDAAVTDAVAAALPPIIETVIIRESADGSQRKVEGMAHPALPDLLACVGVRDFEDRRVPVYISGPAGTGKSFAARQISKVLDLPFYFQSMAIESFDLIGFVDGAGHYHTTPFVEAMRNNAMIFLDELDRWDAAALIVLNPALANGELTLPNGEVVTVNSDFCCVAAGNTNGMGATTEFPTAKRLDQSTLSRFAMRVEWSVDPAFEQEMTAAKYGDDTRCINWTSEIHVMRSVLHRLDLPAMADQRTIQAGCALLVSGMALSRVREMTYLAPFDTETRASILAILGEV